MRSRLRVESCRGIVVGPAPCRGGKAAAQRAFPLHAMSPHVSWRKRCARAGKVCRRGARVCSVACRWAPGPAPEVDREERSAV